MFMYLWKNVFVVYSKEQKGYRCYNPLTRKIVISHYVIFDELGSWCIQKQNSEIDVDSENEDGNKSGNERSCYGNGNKAGQQIPTSIACNGPF